VPSPIEALGTIGLLGGGAAVRYDRQGAFVSDLLAHFFAVVGLVGCDSQRWSGRVQYLFDAALVFDDVPFEMRPCVYRKPYLLGGTTESPKLTE